MVFQAPDCPLHIFDMDHTLIAEDCDVMWKTFLLSKGLVDVVETFWRDFHFQMYRLGRLNPDAYLDYQLQQFAGRTPEEMQPLLQENFERFIRPAIYPQARDYLDRLSRRKCTLAICTSTTAPLARPLQQALNIPHLIATDCALHKGRYNGKIKGTYCFEDGKVDYVRAFCAENGFDLGNMAYYGDSTSDIPLLEYAGYPVACNPVPELARHAGANGWPILNFAD